MSWNRTSTQCSNTIRCIGRKFANQFLVNNPSPLSVSLNNIQWKNKSFDLNENLKTNLPFNKKFETEIDGAISSPTGSHKWLAKECIPQIKKNGLERQKPLQPTLQTKLLY